MKRILISSLAFLSLTACQNSYRTHFSEGNIIESQTVAGLSIGMTKEQVARQMGTPLYENLFRKNRWVYVHHIRKGLAHNSEDVLLDFENNRLAHISKKA